MPTYNVQGWIWSGAGTPTTLLPVTIEDDDPNMSPYFVSDFTEQITIGGTTYTNPRGGTYELTFTDSSGTTHTEDFYLWYTGSNLIFVPAPGSDFDHGSVITGFGVGRISAASFGKMSPVLQQELSSQQNRALLRSRILRLVI